MRFDPYKVLGVEKTATAEQIKTAYREHARRTHPDLGGDAEEFQKISDAYRLLSDPNIRRQFDESGLGPIDPNSPEEIAAKALGDLFSGAFDQASSGFDFDMVEVVRGKIKLIVSGCEDRRFQCQQKIKALEKVKGRLKIPKDGPVSYIGSILYEKIEAEKRAIVGQEAQVRIFKLALAMLSGLSWEGGEEEDEIKTKFLNFSQVFKISIPGISREDSEP